MNQILVCEKVYVTPELKRKKKFYKLELIFSVCLLCLLSSYYIYAEYDRNKSEEVSQEILKNMTFVADDSQIPEEQNNMIIAILNSDETSPAFLIEETEAPEIEAPQEQKQTASDGTEYYTIGVVDVPKLDISYPILSSSSDELLKISVCRFWGPNPNQVGNLCLVAHNYRNSKFFSKISTLEMDDEIKITDLSGNIVTYAVYDKYVIEPTDTGCTSQLTNGNREVTLITCTLDSKHRTVVKAREI